MNKFSSALSATILTMFATSGLASTGTAIKSGFHLGGSVGIGSINGKRQENYSGIEEGSDPKNLSPNTNFQDKLGIAELNAGYLFVHDSSGFTVGPEVRIGFGNFTHDIKFAELFAKVGDALI